MAAHRSTKCRDTCDGSGDDDDGEEGSVRYELNSLLAEIDQALDANAFQSGACFVKADAVAAAAAAASAAP
eukprot:214562-Chlamydomonas_euryale.AAC.1